ncbi:MAG: hypothetical protein A3F12_01590 [Gammaproteobacteria bacterium RIFCSPHIGHO2_12_FULL_38_14]|nr:MAG: hypothetical protein A3F12_01590 [Gammaproteobacteria bacterium RIFCSPHIGHO2_12_FULL_38_14]
MHNASYKPTSQVIVPEEVVKDFLQAATDGNVDLMRSLLTSKQMVVNGVAPSQTSALAFLGGSKPQSARRPAVDIALYRVKKNLSALKMLLEEFNAPIPPYFLNSVETREVAEYLINVYGLDPYAKERNEKKRSEDGNCPYFSAKNVQRLHKEQYRLLRPSDYEAIGKALNKISGVLITKVNSGGCYNKPTASGEVSGSQAPWFRCSSPEDAETLAKFLREECNLSFYHVMHTGSCEVYSRESLPDDGTCDHSNFIMAVGVKAGIYELLSDNNDQQTETKKCCVVM